MSECDIRKLGSFKSIVKLKLLVRLNLSHNYLQGMPPTVKKLVNLEELDISFNDIKEIPWELYQLGNLRVLITEGNGITSLPTPAISRLVKLEVRVSSGTEARGGCTPSRWLIHSISYSDP